jgi:hypothetical protein
LPPPLSEEEEIYDFSVIKWPDLRSFYFLGVKPVFFDTKIKKNGF